MTTKTAAVLYATSEGHTRRVAERFASGLRARGIRARILDVRDAADPARAAVAAVVLAASTHGGRHQRDMVRFARRYRSSIEAIPNAFISVSLSEAGAEDAALTDADREKHGAAVRSMIDRFVDDTGWRPRRVFPVAGALSYTRYNFVVRWVMKRIARRAQGATDASRDHVYTDWARLDRFAGAFADEVLEQMRAPETSTSPA